MYESGAKSGAAMPRSAPAAGRAVFAVSAAGAAARAATADAAREDDDEDSAEVLPDTSRGAAARTLALFGAADGAASRADAARVVAAGALSPDWRPDMVPRWPPDEDKAEDCAGADICAAPSRPARAASAGVDASSARAGANVHANSANAVKIDGPFLICAN
jgi:hypothetical protein